MQIFFQYNYNQSISRYKLLSANAGVGSIITTTIGNYILISDIQQWEFISKANRRIRDIRGGAGSPEEWYKKAKEEIMRELGVEVVDDERFVSFLKLDKSLANLLCLAAIPHLSLNENYNSVNVGDNPVIKRLKERGADPKSDWYTIPGTHFPKWFRNEEGLLKTYGEWKEEWMRKGLPEANFAPPRDAQHPYPKGEVKINKAGDTIRIYKELTQLNLILICEHGHLSDIPWSRYLRWKAEGVAGGGDGSDLLLAGQPCCDRPQLKWTENRNRSEGYASIYLECTNCGRGGGNRKVNLEGINNFKPICAGHKPWEISLEKGRDMIPYDAGCSDRSGQPTRMQVALVTGNNVYFANTFSSLYVPIDLVKGLPEGMEGVLQHCRQRYEKLSNPAKTLEGWADKYIQEDLLDDLEIDVEEPGAFLSQLKKLFIDGETELLNERGDLHEQYRRQEYAVLTRYSGQPNGRGRGLKFEDIELPEELDAYFTTIAKVEELKVTTVQLDFTRVRLNERVLGIDGKVAAQAGMNIFSGKPEEMSILPAVENFGEGIFFQFKEAALERWGTEHKTVFENRLKELLPKGSGFNGNAVRQKVRHIGPAYLLIHTFSHLILRELEFTCGYPTASLKERLYISKDMAGVLIYTAEGSEGSMGGLIWQAEGDRMRELLYKALKRAMDCSSDPLCWESEGQGLFNLNLAACFSCGLVAETACEERNLALDRRVMVDEEFGFFRSILY
jgi:hypothetical protein